MFTVGERTSREERRRIQRTQANLVGIGAIVFLLAAGAILALLFLSASGMKRAAAVKLEPVVTQEPVVTAAVVEAVEPTLLLPIYTNSPLMEPEALPTEVIWALAPEEAEPPPRGKLLESVPLDAETQIEIYNVCGQDPELFCFAMAIAARESNFQPAAVNGYCYGMMQINTRWHTARMEALGVTDLMDPAQCVEVAVDYLRELDGVYGWPLYSHQILMAYNAGPSGARNALANGVTQTDYSRNVLAMWADYCAELEG